MNANISDRPSFSAITDMPDIFRSSLFGDKVEKIDDISMVRTCTLRGLDLLDADISSYYFKCWEYFDELEGHYPVKKNFDTYMVVPAANGFLVPRRVVAKADALAEELDIPVQKVYFYATIRGLIQYERDEEIDRINYLNRAFDKM